MKHEIAFDVRHFQGCFSCERTPILTIESGDSIRCAVPDAAWGLDPFAVDVFHKSIKPEARVDPANDLHHCMVGPIAIHGAKPGQTLQVEVLTLIPEDVGWTWVGANADFAAELGISSSLHVAWRIDAAAREARSHLGHRVKIAPFLGVMGLAPAEPGIHSSTPPRRVGGNIDCKELVVGSSLFLPIAVDDAFFAFGDGHAAQGDGEVCGTALECGFKEVELRLTLRDDLPIEWPQARVPGGWLTFGFDADLRQATIIAMRSMLDHLCQTFGLSRSEAHALASLSVDLRITQIANDVLGVHAFLPDGFAA